VNSGDFSSTLIIDGMPSAVASWQKFWNATMVAQENTTRHAKPFY
jgi:hypothetical protein